jgi:hypothetical protein
MTEELKKTSIGEDKDKIIETLYSELNRRDKMIDKLREENTILMRTAMRREEKRMENY